MTCESRSTVHSILRFFPCLYNFNFTVLSSSTMRIPSFILMQFLILWAHLARSCLQFLEFFGNMFIPAWELYWIQWWVCNNSICHEFYVTFMLFTMCLFLVSYLVTFVIHGVNPNWILTFWIGKPSLQQDESLLDTHTITK